MTADSTRDRDAAGAALEHPRDEVDRIVAAWACERPDLDVTPLTVLSRVTRLARYLDLARRGSFARHGLETWEFDVLSALRRAGARERRPPRPDRACCQPSWPEVTRRRDTSASRLCLLYTSDAADDLLCV